MKVDMDKGFPKDERKRLEFFVHPELWEAFNKAYKDAGMRYRDDALEDSLKDWTKKMIKKHGSK